MATNTIPQIMNNSGTGYCKMPDGTLICWGYKEATFTTSNWHAWDNLYYSDNIQFDNFAVSFSRQPYVFVSQYAGEDAITANVKGTSTTNPGRIYLVRPTTQTTASASYGLEYLAIGRWK